MLGIMPSENRGAGREVWQCSDVKHNSDTKPGEARGSSGDQAAKVGALVPTGVGLPGLPKKLILELMNT